MTRIKAMLLITLSLFGFHAFKTIAADITFVAKLDRLQHAYPSLIHSVNNLYITWSDGTKMLLDDTILNDTTYPSGQPVNFAHYQPMGDPGRMRYQPFFMKMYGHSAKAVKQKLTVIYWMPKLFGHRYPLAVTTVNAVDKKLALISAELELLVSTHPTFLKFLDHPAGTFYWRFIRHTHRQSLHSYGIAMDINPNYTHYWQTDLERDHLPIAETMHLTYRNTLPWEIVNIFEKHGFIWGGKWYHYDTMHFEYRPELYD